MLSKEVSSTIFKVFGMTRPGIEPRSPGPLANTLVIFKSQSALSVGAVEYTDRISTKEYDPTNEYPGFDTKPSDGQPPAKEN